MGRDDDARAAWRQVMSLLLGAEMFEQFHAACAAVGLPHPGALRILFHLQEGGAPSMGEVADVLRCDASYVTALVDTLEAAGYAERRVAAGDRRVKRVHLTEAGRAAREAALDVLANPPKALERLSAAETRTLARLLGKVAG